MKQKGMTEVNPDDLISEMTQVQLEVARDYLAIKTEFPLTLAAGQTNYRMNLGIFKIRDFILPSAWKRWHPETGLEVLNDSSEWAHVVNESPFGIANPRKAFIWNGILRLWPAPAVAGEILVILAYALPTRALVYMGDPETGIEFDDCLEYEVRFRVTGEAAFHQLYLDNARKISGQNFKEALTGPILIDSPYRRLGF